jgi:hypothetical protein
MTSTARRLFGLLTVMTVVGSLAAVPATAAFGRSDQPVPITGSAVTDDAMLPPIGCPEGTMWRYLAIGSGHFSHLGAVDIELTHCSRMTSEVAGEFGSGIVTLTAANDDVLTLSSWGTFELVFGSAGPEYSIIDMQWVITGGTGRFTGATGSGTTTGIGDLVAETTAADFIGTITYDASQRSAR